MSESIFCPNPLCGKEVTQKNYMKAVFFMCLPFFVLMGMAMCEYGNFFVVKWFLILDLICFILSLLMPGKYDIRAIEDGYRICPYCGNVEAEN